MEISAENILKVQKKKIRRGAKGTENLRNKILRELIKDHIEREENKNLNEKKVLNIKQLYRLIPKSQYGNVHRAVNHLERKSKIINSHYSTLGRIVELNPNWVEVLKENYEKNNGEISIFLISDSNNIRFLEYKAYNKYLDLYDGNIKIEFEFEDDVRDLIDNNKQSELGDNKLWLIQQFIPLNMGGFTINSLKDEEIRDLVIRMWKKKLLKGSIIFY